MRNFTLCSLLFIISLACAGQDTSSLKSSKKVSFQQRSRDQRAGGWLLAAAGTVGFIATLGSDAGQALESVATWGQSEYNSSTVGYVVSGACLASAIYLFTAAARNKTKWKATSVSIGMEKTDVLKYNTVYKRSFPAIGLKIRI